MRWLVIVGMIVLVIMAFVSLKFYLRSGVAKGAAITGTPAFEQESDSDSCAKECISSCTGSAACLEECLYTECGVEGPASVSVRIV